MWISFFTDWTFCVYGLSGLLGFGVTLWRMAASRKAGKQVHSDAEAPVAVTTPPAAVAAEPQLPFSAQPVAYVRKVRASFLTLSGGVQVAGSGCSAFQCSCGRSAIHKASCAPPHEPPLFTHRQCT